ALQVYWDNAGKWNYDQRARDQWCKQVGGAQTRLPAHVANEYCRTDRAFEPCPVEWESKLPRRLALKMWDSTQSKTVDGVWFRPPSSKDGLGVNYAFLRGTSSGGWGAQGINADSGRHVGRCDCDLEALRSLWKTRTQQLEWLKSQLLSVANPSQVYGR
ncbi:MAG: hypothetical protein JSR33_09505, partial [Proteobacteria bacterium]|nr:hypothetical protein [Pseudomonadota bacterium]